MRSRAAVMNKRERAAHTYADAGWHVFPCRPGGKEPVTRHGLNDATVSHRDIERWWSRVPAANVAIRTGAPYGPDVLDIDRKGERSGFPALNRLLRAELVPGAKAEVRTPSGGMHLFYRGTDQRNGHLPRQLIDYRATGGYILAAPSGTEKGLYHVVSHRPSDWAFDWQAARDHLEPQAQIRQEHSQRQAQDGQDAGLPGWVARQPEGNRNSGLHWAACRVVEHGNDHLLPGLAEAAKAAGLLEREVQATLRSAQRSAEPLPKEPERDREAAS